MSDDEKQQEEPEEQINEGEEKEEDEKEEPELDSQGNPIEPGKGPRKLLNPEIIRSNEQVI